MKKRTQKLPTKPTAPKRRPRAVALPGMEDRQIAPLEELAAEIAAIRDERAALLERDTNARQKALAVMEQLRRVVYRRDGIEIRVKPGHAELIVKVKPAAATPAPARGSAGPD